MQMEHDRQLIKEFIDRQVKERNSNGVVLGLSGGLDSSVAAKLCVEALGSKYVLGLIMPDLYITPRSDTRDAESLASFLKIEHHVIEIRKIKQEFLRNIPQSRYVIGNLASRIRMCLLYYYAGLMNKLVLGTTDKSELMLGYYTKYGDSAADLFPLADLYKTEVRALAKHLHIPSHIINKKSSPRLWKNHLAEQEIGLSYQLIDDILRQIENRSLDNTSLKKCAISKIFNIMEKNKHKLETRPICNLRLG